MSYILLILLIILYVFDFTVFFKRKLIVLAALAVLDIKPKRVNGQ